MNGSEIWSQANETLNVLVWPAVVGAAIYGFRAQLSKLSARIRQADTPAGKVLFDAQADAERLTPALEGAERVVVDSVLAISSRLTRYESVLAILEAEDNDAETRSELTAAIEAVATVEPRPPDLLDIQGEIETLIQSSFEAGFLAAQSRPNMTYGPPRPVIKWRGAEPYVAGWSTPIEPPDVDDDPPTTPGWQREVRRKHEIADAKDDISTLEAQLAITLEGTDERRNIESKIAMALGRLRYWEEGSL
jgi:hypothetical protein